MSLETTEPKNTTGTNVTNRVVPVEITRNKFTANGEYGVLNLTVEWPAGLIGVEGCDVRVLDIDLPLKGLFSNGNAKWIVNPTKSSSIRATQHNLVSKVIPEEISSVMLEQLKGALETVELPVPVELVMTTVENKIDHGLVLYDDAGVMRDLPDPVHLAALHTKPADTTASAGY